MTNTPLLPAGPLTHAVCVDLDRGDPLARHRVRFQLPPDEIYLDGNSLGALPRSVVERMRRAVVDEWGSGLIRSWNDAGWYLAPQRTGAKIARLVGANAEEVIVCDSTSVNLFKAVVAAARLRSDRNVLIAERDNFPTDVYVAEGACDLLGMTLRLAAPEEMENAIRKEGDRLAIVQLTEVNYKTGYRYDMARITAAAHEAGALVIWDLCHSAGALPVDLNGCGVDFAVGCGYKYLNGGPGAPAYVFVAQRHLNFIRQPLTGWHGHAQPFSFTQNYEPDPGIARMLVGTAPQLSLLALEEALDVFADVDMGDVRVKSVMLGDLFIRLVDQELPGYGFQVVSPRDSALRGSQVSLRHPEGYAIMQALISREVIGDFRSPNILRFGLAPLYVSYDDVWRAVERLRQVMETNSWDISEFRTRKAVT